MKPSEAAAARLTAHFAFEIEGARRASMHRAAALVQGMKVGDQETARATLKRAAKMLLAEATEA